MSTIDVIIPTYRPKKKLISILESLAAQTVRPARIILMNTEKELFIQNQELLQWVEAHSDLIEVHHVKKEEFDHGKTRGMGVSHSRADFFLCMTDDAVPADSHLIEYLLNAFADESVAIAYARQLPSEDCALIERLTRTFNYNDIPMKKTESMVPELGIKTYFCSNACAAYRRSVFDALGGFIQKTIFNEDMIYAAGAVRAGHAICYVPAARVYHSHNYKNMEQLHRNFDLGVSQADHPEVFAQIPSEGEGMKMVRIVRRQLIESGHRPMVLSLYVKSGFKLIGYKLGKNYRKLPKGLVRKLSMNKEYFKTI